MLRTLLGLSVFPTGIFMLFLLETVWPCQLDAGSLSVFPPFWVVLFASFSESCGHSLLRKNGRSVGFRRRPRGWRGLGGTVPRIIARFHGLLQSKSDRKSMLENSGLFGVG